MDVGRGGSEWPRGHERCMLKASNDPSSASIEPSSTLGLLFSLSSSELNTMTLIGPCLRSRAQLSISSTDNALFPSLCSLSGSDQRSKQLRRERVLRNADLEMIPAPLLCISWSHAHCIRT